MKTADFYQGTADAMGVALYLYPDGSVTNSRKMRSRRKQRLSLMISGNLPTIMVCVSRYRNLTSRALSHCLVPLTTIST